VERVGSATAASGQRRIVLLTILASAMLGLAGVPARAQRALTTPRGTGRPKLQRAAQLTLAWDLEHDGRTSARERKPILLFFDREECPYCEQALREHLVPLSREGWKDRALFRQIEMDRTLPLVDFDGKTTTHEDFAARLRMSLSPTVLVVDGNGSVLSGPLVGLMTVDFYGAYLENALDEAAKKLAA
jgi:thioredoxin-related protein